LNDATVSAESEKDKGSKFTVILKQDNLKP
jgi:hypothetical protein